jgi:hypothetical protein
MAEATQFNAERLRLVLDNGEEVELDGGTLALGDEESPSVMLRLAPWRARSMARVLEEWSAVSRVFSPGTAADPCRAGAVSHAGPGGIRAR